MLTELPSSDLFVENASDNYLNNSNKETISTSSYKSYSKNLQKSEIKETSSETCNNPSTVANMEPHGEKDRRLDSFKAINTYSQTDEIIDISDGDDYYDMQNVQNFAHIKTEPEDVEDLEYNEIYKEIFEGSDGTEDSSNVINENSPFDENQEIESIEKIKNFVNCFAQSKSVEHKAGNSEESDSNFTDQESEISSEENFLSSVKYSTFENTVPGAKKSFGKTLLTEPKPMTYRPRYVRGRDEGYVERPKQVDRPARKRGRPKKQEQFLNEAISLNSSVPITELPNKPEKPIAVRKNLKTKSLAKGNDFLKRADMTFENRLSSKNKNNKPSNKNVSTVSKPMQNYPSKEMLKLYDFDDESKRSLDLFAKRKRGRPTKGYFQEERKLSISDSQTKLPRKYHKSKEKNHVDEHPKKKVPSDSNANKISKHSAPSVKVRPDKFSSRMGFLTIAEGVKPLNRDKISTANKKDNTKNKKHQDVINGRNNGSGSKATTAKPVNKVFEKLVVPGNVSASNCKEKENPKLDQQPTTSHRNYQSLRIENLKGWNISPISADDSRRLSTSKEDKKLAFELSFNYIVKSLTKLKTIWLQEQRTISHPPSEVTQDVAPLPLSFTSYESYVSLFYPLIRLDIWQYMFEESKNVFSSKKMCNRFSFRVLSFIHKHECIELRCESVLNDKFYFEPREGVIAALEMKMNLFQSYSLFGFILKHQIDSLDLLHPCWKKTPTEYLKDAKRYTFSILIKQKELLLEPDILMKGNGICYIRSRLRLVNALRYFKDSPLLTDIIQPKLSTCDLNITKASPNREYTSRQLEIIQAICSGIKKPYRETKITLLHGPPGTGKTHIIIGILEALFYASKYDSNLKVLITAPSNVAVDEIGCRLIDLDERYCFRDYTVKFVRIGVEKHVHSKMLPYFVDRKASERYRKTARSYRQKEKEVQDLRMKILSLEREPNNLNKEIMLKNLKERCKYIKNQISLKESCYLTEMKCKYEILKESHIVLSTLSSCSLPVLCKTFQQKSGTSFSCCIVDESTQCNELEILQPLALGISKLVLVGDEKQLPSAYSEYSKKYGFGRSMFERFCSYFKSTDQPSPVLTLTEQFRMHPAICQFPSTYMYDKKLDTHPDVTLRYRDFPLKPYFILDIAHSNDSSSENIRDCEVLVYNICKFLQRAVNSFSSVGVIVPHEYQRSLCAKSLHSRFRDVEVNTVNGFQGREIDIIILYAIESKCFPAVESFITCKRRFNVALTRAKKCLIICLDSSPLMKYSHWKALIYNAQERKVCFTVTSPKDIYLVLNFSFQKKK